MQMRPIQVCRSNDGWQPVKIASESEENLEYLVLVNPWGQPGENLCECPGYTFRGRCKHQSFAAAKVCRWAENNPQYKVKQTEQDKETMTCPACDGQTKWEFEVVEDKNA